MRETTESSRENLASPVTNRVVLVSSSPLWASALQDPFRIQGISLEWLTTPSGLPGTVLLDGRGALDDHLDRAGAWVEAGWRTVLVQVAVCTGCQAFLQCRGIEPVPEELSLMAWKHVVTAIARHQDLEISVDPSCPREPPEAMLLAQLSPREREVVRLIATGYRTRDAAKSLWLSPRTVESHRLNALRKLGVATTADLVRIAVKGCLV